MAKTEQASKLGGFSKDIYKVLDAYEHALLARFPRTRYLVGYDARFVWMRQKRIQGSHFAHLKQAAQANQLVIERRLDPCMSEVFPWAEIPEAHMKMRRNEHKPGNMAVLVQAMEPGRRTVEDCVES